MKETTIPPIPPLFIKCQCSGHCVEIDRFYYKHKDQIDDGFNLSFWNIGLSGKLSWRERIRWCYNIIKTGTPWSDGIVIGNEQAKQIIEYIYKYLPRNDVYGKCGK